MVRVLKSPWFYILVALVAFPFFAGDFYIYLVSEALLISLLALSNNLELGYGGMLQLHQCTYYGVGAYAFSLLLLKTSCPAPIAFLIAAVIASVVGLIIGWFCVRLHGIYFGMLTLALGQLVWAIVFKWYSFTGGDNGLQGIPIPSFLTSVRNSYFFILLVVSISTYILYLITKSPFGRILQGIRDNRARCEAVGINVRKHQIITYTIGSFFAGVAGVLFVIHARSVSPDMMFWEKSAEVLVMCLLGGVFTFSGPIFGAFAITLFNALSSAYTEYQAMFLGIILIILVIFLPEGVIGSLGRRRGEGAS